MSAAAIVIATLEGFMLYHVGVLLVFSIKAPMPEWTYNTLIDKSTNACMDIYDLPVNEGTNACMDIYDLPVNEGINDCMDIYMTYQ